MNLRKMILVAMAGAFVFADADVALAQNQIEPIPGVDIIVKRKPPRGEALTGVSDALGRFAFRDVAAGQYEVTVIPRQTRASISTTRSNIKHGVSPVNSDEGVKTGAGAIPADQWQTRQAINTSRSNIKHATEAMETEGGRLVTLDVELGGEAATTIVTIRADHSTIAGTVTRAEGAEEALPEPSRRR